MLRFFQIDLFRDTRASPFLPITQIRKISSGTGLTEDCTNWLEQFKAIWLVKWHDGWPPLTSPLPPVLCVLWWCPTKGINVVARKIDKRPRANTLHAACVRTCTQGWPWTHHSDWWVVYASCVIAAKMEYTSVWSAAVWSITSTANFFSNMERIATLPLAFWLQD